MRKIMKTALAAVLCALSVAVPAQTIYKYEQRDSSMNRGVTLTFFSKTLSQYIPHIIRQYEHGKALHDTVWGRPAIQPPFMMLTDWEDDGNGGAAPLPSNVISIGMAPVNMSYYISPTTERYAHLFKHEYTHTVMTDRPNARDAWWRSLFGTKVVAQTRYPLTSVWSYLTVPRWYAPRWYHEGIACCMETWLGGGVGRALGGYDEMYFRNLVAERCSLSTVVGLESEGSTKDFQLGTNAYLYGTRFVNYLAMRYGYERVIRFYNRTPGSKAFFAAQFREVFGKRLTDVWDEWQAYEHEHQMQNLAAVNAFPVTPLRRLTAVPYGSASPLVVDAGRMKGYTAVNYPGDFAHLEEIDLRSGSRRRLAVIDGPMMYQTAYVAFDRRRRRLFWTDRNNGIRGIRWMTLSQDRHRSDTASDTTAAGLKVTGSGHLTFQRTSNIVYDNARDMLYGLMSHEGVTHLVRYDAALSRQDVLYTFPFGVSVSDLDVSHDGQMLAMTLVGLRGQNSLVLFSVDNLENADFSYHTLRTLGDTNLSQFRFSHDDTSLVGTSYYTGVANIWEIPVDRRALSAGTVAAQNDSLQDSLPASGTPPPANSDSPPANPEPPMRLLSNVQSGLFAPYLAPNDSIYAMEFTRNGLLPVVFRHAELHDCNAVVYLGQKTYDANPAVRDLATLRVRQPAVSFGEVYDSIKVYHPLRELRFQGAYPDISGFTDADAWNSVTPVLACHVAFSDPIGVNRLNLSAGISPWSHNPWKNRFHAEAEFESWGWRVTAAWNPTNFYDLFGPTRRSRKGYTTSVGYTYSNTLCAPFSWNWGVTLAAYGDMDALPLYQNVGVEDNIHSFQTLAANIGAAKVRTSLGGLVAEQGYQWNVSGYTYLAKGRLYPSLTATYDTGVLLPVMRNTSAWLRLAAGQAFGDSDSAFGNEYFGGFGNNYVDCGKIFRYRDVNSMPGTEIDNITAHSFCKAMGEVNLQPLRFRNVGMLCLYPTYAQMSLFATDLMANAWGEGRFNNYINVGAQLNIEVVLFNYMKTTWSVGYAQLFSQRTSGLRRSGGEFLISLKLL